MSYYISNVRIFDGNRVYDSPGHIVIADNVITWASTHAPSPEDIPEGCIEIPGAGHTALPGLLDAHVHVEESMSTLSQCLAFGVTTALEMFNEPENMVQFREATAKRDDIADFRSSGYGGTVAGGWPGVIQRVMGVSNVEQIIAKYPNLQSEAEARDLVKSNVAHGATHIKLFQEDGEMLKPNVVERPLPTPKFEVQQALCDEAHRNGVIAVAHALTLNATLTVLRAGVDGMVHGFIDRPLTADAIAAFKKNNAFFCPTLSFLTSATSEEQASRELFAQHLNEHRSKLMCGCMAIAADRMSVEHAFKATKQLKETGIDILCGTDCGSDESGRKGFLMGISVHHELWLLVHRCGLSTIEALQSATSVPARRFGLGDRGTIEKGKRADIVLVKGDPTIDIDCTKNIVDIWRRGVRFIKPT